MRGKRVVPALAVCLLLSNCTNKINTLEIMHSNINCSDFEQSHSFYSMLGFASLMESDVDVSEEAAAGLRMPPYQLHASPMTHSDGYIIDLIEWIEPYDPSPPYAFINHLGLSHLSLKTTNLDEDMTTLQAQGVVFFSDPVTIDRPVANSRLVEVREPEAAGEELLRRFVDAATLR